MFVLTQFIQLIPDSRQKLMASGLQALYSNKIACVTLFPTIPPLSVFASKSNGLNQSWKQIQVDQMTIHLSFLLHLYCEKFKSFYSHPHTQVIINSIIFYLKKVNYIEFTNLLLKDRHSSQYSLKCNFNLNIELFINTMKCKVSTKSF